MAQFIASIDASPQRREAVMARAKALLNEHFDVDNFFRVMNRWALSPGDVKELLRDIIEPGAVDALVDELRHAYDAPQCQ